MSDTWAVPDCAVVEWVNPATLAVITSANNIEVERLRADVLVLRAALQSLYDATDAVTIKVQDAYFEDWYDDVLVARAAAGVVLGGGNDGLPANPEFDIDNDDGSF